MILSGFRYIHENIERFDVAEIQLRQQIMIGNAPDTDSNTAPTPTATPSSTITRQGLRLYQGLAQHHALSQLRNLDADTLMDSP